MEFAGKPFGLGRKDMYDIKDMHHIKRCLQSGRQRYLNRQWADEIAVGCRSPAAKNINPEKYKPRLDAQLLHNWFIGITGHDAKR